MNSVYEIIRKRKEEQQDADNEYDYEKWELDALNDTDGVTLNSMDAPEYYVDGVKVIQNKPFVSTEIVPNSNNMANIETLSVKNLTSNELQSVNIKTDDISSIADTLSIQNNSITIDNNDTVVVINKHIDNTPNDITTRYLYCDAILTNNIIMPNGYLNITDNVDELQTTTNTVNTITYNKFTVEESSNGVSIYNKNVVYNPNLLIQSQNKLYTTNIIFYDDGRTKINSTNNPIEFTHNHMNNLWKMYPKTVALEGTYSIFEGGSTHAEIGQENNPINTVYSKRFLNPSSKVLKTDIKNIDLDSAIELIMQLSPCTYRYKDSVSDLCSGFIIEDIMETHYENDNPYIHDMIESILFYDKKGKPKCISNASLIAICIAALKQQQIKINQMEIQMNQMKDQINELFKRTN